MERKNSLKDASLGMKRYFNISTASSAEEVFELPAFPPSAGARNSCLHGLRAVPGDTEVRALCLLMAVGVNRAAEQNSTQPALLHKL